MIGNALIVLLFVSVALFLDWRLLHSFRHRRAWAYRTPYLRDVQPVQYWTSMIVLLVASLLFSAIGLLFVMGLWDGWY